MEIINRYGINGNGFADDCGAVLGGTHLSHILKNLQKMTDELTQWGNGCGLKFNESKTVVVHFTRRKKKNPFELKVNGTPVPFSDTVKYLGVTLDSKLHWTSHIQEKIVKCKRLLMTLVSATRSNIGPKPNMMKWAYTGIVRPTLSYAALVWAHEIGSKRIKDQLKRLDRLAMLAFAQTKPSTPTEGLSVIYDLSLIHI